MTPLITLVLQQPKLWLLLILQNNAPSIIITRLTHSCVPITGSIQSLGYVGVAGKQHSIQKVAAADLPSPGGGATNAESANAADPVTVAAKTTKMTIRVSSIIIKNNNSSNSGALSTAPGAYADTEPVLGPVTEPLDPANKTKKGKEREVG